MSKRAFVLKLVQDTRASYWFLPTVLVLAAIVLAQITQYFDHHGDAFPVNLPQAWRTTQVEGARSTLALISQSMIGVAGVMFSMTIVAVSFASGNFGPRLIGNFMRDRGNQLSLGILISTFVYTLLVLRAVQSPFGEGSDNATDAFVPHLSMLVAFVLTGLSVMSMIYYVHHIPEIINVSNISAALGGRLRCALQARIDAHDGASDDENLPFPDRPEDHQITLSGNGYIQTWNLEQLMEIATEHSLFLQAHHSAGDFVTQYDTVLAVWGGDDMDDDLQSKLRDCFALGTTPTEPQNLLFIVEQLVEMIARALSPGVNDPYTAINCLNWLQVGLLTAANYNGGLSEKVHGRVRYGTLDFDKLLTSAIRDPLRYICADPLARQHLERMMNRMRDAATEKNMRQSIEVLSKEIAEISNQLDLP